MQQSHKSALARKYYALSCVSFVKLLSVAKHKIKFARASGVIFSHVPLFVRALGFLNLPMVFFSNLGTDMLEDSDSFSF